jgi:hypothetical protein
MSAGASSATAGRADAAGREGVAEIAPTGMVSAIPSRRGGEGGRGQHALGARVGEDVLQLERRVQRRQRHRGPAGEEDPQQRLGVLDGRGRQEGDAGAVEAGAAGQQLAGQRAAVWHAARRTSSPVPSVDDRHVFGEPVRGEAIEEARGGGARCHAAMIRGRAGVGDAGARADLEPQEGSRPPRWDSGGKAACIPTRLGDRSGGGSRPLAGFRRRAAGGGRETERVMSSKRALDLALLLPALPVYALATAVLALAVLTVDGRPVCCFRSRG